MLSKTMMAFKKPGGRRRSLAERAALRLLVLSRRAASKQTMMIGKANYAKQVKQSSPNNPLNRCKGAVCMCGGTLKIKLPRKDERPADWLADGSGPAYGWKKLALTYCGAARRRVLLTEAAENEQSEHNETASNASFSGDASTSRRRRAQMEFPAGATGLDAVQVKNRYT